MQAVREISISDFWIYVSCVVIGRGKFDRDILEMIMSRGSTNEGHF